MFRALPVHHELRGREPPRLPVHAVRQDGQGQGQPQGKQLDKFRGRQTKWGEIMFEGSEVFKNADPDNRAVNCIIIIQQIVIKKVTEYADYCTVSISFCF